MPFIDCIRNPTALLLSLPLSRSQCQCFQVIPKRPLIRPSRRPRWLYFFGLFPIASASEHLKFVSFSFSLQPVFSPSVWRASKSYLLSSGWDNLDYKSRRRNLCSTAIRVRDCFRATLAKIQALRVFGFRKDPLTLGCLVCWPRLLLLFIRL